MDGGGDGFAFLSEDLLRASVLVPKRKVQVPLALEVEEEEERLPIEVASKRRETDIVTPPSNRISFLLDKVQFFNNIMTF